MILRILRAPPDRMGALSRHLSIPAGGTMSRLRSALPILVAIVATWYVTTVSAQSSIPDGVFVRRSDGTIWLVLGGQRIHVPIWPASDTEIAALPESDRYAVMNDDGVIVAGDRPGWLTASSSAPPTGSPTTAPAVTVVTPTRKQPVVVAVPTNNGSTEPMMLLVHAFADPIVSLNPDLAATYGRYVAFDVTAQNIGATPAMLNPKRFTIQSASDAVYQALGAPIRDPMLPVVNLWPGQSSRGEVAYLLPLDERPARILWDSTVVLDLTQH
jgi:hypothetical protein